VHKRKQQILQGRLYILFQKSAARMQYTMFKQCFIVLGFKDAHSLNYNTFQEESRLHQRVFFSKYGVLSWKKNTMYSE